MPLEQADVGFGGGIRTTPNALDPGSCIDTFVAEIGDDSSIAGSDISLTYRFKPRAAANGNLAKVAHTDPNGIMRRWDLSVVVDVTDFRVSLYYNAGAGGVLVHDFVAAVADTNEHSVGFSYDGVTSLVYFDGVLADTRPGIGPLLAAASDDSIWVQSCPVLAIAGEEIDIGEIGYIGEVVNAAQFVKWHSDGVG
jgi:hypothetical protein